MYFTRTDSSGLYNLRNIKEGEYKIYALYEPKHNLIYQKNKQEIVAFLEAPLTIDQHKDSINFALTHYDLDTLEIGKMRARKQFFEVRTNKIFTNYSVKFDSSHYDTLIYHQQMEQNIIFFGKNGETDSVDLHLLVEDSLGMTAEQDIRIKINSVKKPAKIEFAHATFAKSALTEATFAKAKFTEATFTEANCSEVTFAKATFAEARFAKAESAKANLSKARFDEAKFAKAKSTKAKLAEAQLPKLYLLKLNMLAPNLPKLDSLKLLLL